MDYKEFLEAVIGNKFTKVEGMFQDSEEIIFELENGDKWKMYHSQDCCEEVWLEDINGKVEDILNTPILKFDEKVQDDEEAYESGTYTFYTIVTEKGYVDLRWHGESNGYYSESVDFTKLN